MLRTPNTALPKITSQIKLYINPNKTTIFMDDTFVENINKFNNIEHDILVNAGKHRIKIALPKYQTFETEMSLLTRQKITIKTDLLPMSVSQTTPSNKPE